MKPSHHVIASTVISAGVQATMHSWPATTACFLSGIFIDIDHHLEYWFILKKFPFKYQDLMTFCWDRKVSKVYLIFHAYEYFIILWLSILLFGLGKIWIGLGIGLTTHMAFDQFTNPNRPLFYFLTYRILNNFDKSKILIEKWYTHAPNYKPS
jgi:hypothetical protein